MNTSPQPPRRRVLIVGHATLRNSSAGGTERYISAEMASLGDCFEFFYYYPVRSEGGYFNRCELVNSENVVLFTHYFARRDVDLLLNDPQRNRSFALMLQDLSIDLVHIHHLSGHSPSLINVANWAKIPTVFTAHDFYSTCIHLHLEGIKGEYCGIMEVGTRNCDDCLAKTKGLESGSFASRLDAIGNLISQVQLVHVPLDYLNLWMQNIFSHHLSAVRIVSKSLPTLNDRLYRLSSESAILRVVIPGNFIDIKGRQTILRAIEQLKGEQIRFIFVGTVSTKDQDILRLNKNVELNFCGSASQYADEMARADISLHMSVVPETFSFTLSEAWSSGTVPIASDLGAFRHRIKKGIDGVLIPSGSDKELVSALRRLLGDRQSLAKLKNNSPTLFAADVHWNWLKGEYHRLIQDYATSFGNVPSLELVEFEQSWSPNHTINLREAGKLSARILISSVINCISRLTFRVSRFIGKNFHIRRKVV